MTKNGKNGQFYYAYFTKITYSFIYLKMVYHRESISFFQNNIASMTILASLKTKSELSVELFLLSKVANYSIKRMLIQTYFNA